MTPEEKSLLERTHKLAEDNNVLLRKIRRSAMWENVFRVIYWVVIIALGLGAYYALQPYLMKSVDIINKGQSIINGIIK